MAPPGSKVADFDRYASTEAVLLNRKLFRGGIIVFAAVASMWGQATDGNVVGNVSDPSGQAVPGVALRASNRDTGMAYAATSSADGSYRFQNLPIGSYEVSANAQGFSAALI